MKSNWLADLNPFSQIGRGVALLLVLAMALLALNIVVSGSPGTASAAEPAQGQQVHEFSGAVFIDGQPAPRHGGLRPGQRHGNSICLCRRLRSVFQPAGAHWRNIRHLHSGRPPSCRNRHHAGRRIHNTGPERDPPPGESSNQHARTNSGQHPGLIPRWTHRCACAR